MNRGIKQVRKSINQRKNGRYVNSKSIPNKRLTPSFPQEEEKHGYFPIFTDTGEDNTGKSRFISGMVLKGILSVILFGGVAFLFQSEMDLLQDPKEWTSSALTEEFPFAKVNQWYQETFGSPLAFTPNQVQQVDGEQNLAIPVSGDITESFQANGTGIMIAPDKRSDVYVLQKGVVIFAGNDPETGKTVVVQHANGSTSSYGNLSSIDVHLYEFVSNNQQLGYFVPNEDNKTVYFSIEQDNEYIDPVQVIKVDDQE